MLQVVPGNLLIHSIVPTLLRQVLCGIIFCSEAQSSRLSIITLSLVSPALDCCFSMQLFSPELLNKPLILVSAPLTPLEIYYALKTLKRFLFPWLSHKWCINSGMFFLVSLFLEEWLPLSTLLFEWNPQLREYDFMILSPWRLFLCLLAPYWTEYGAHSWPSWSVR